MVDNIKTTVKLSTQNRPTAVHDRVYTPFEHKGIRFTADKERGYVADRESLSKIGLGNLHLRFGWGEYANFHVSNSLHKLCHEGYNHTDFTQSQLIDIIDHISDILEIDAAKFLLHGKIELAVNIPVQDANAIIEACFQFKSLPMFDMMARQKSYGKKARASKYDVKIYNPMLKLKYQGVKHIQEDNKLLRFEIVIDKSYINKTWGIDLQTLKDFQNEPILRALGAKFINMSKSLKFNPVLPDDLEPKHLEKYYYFRAATKAQTKYFRDSQESTYRRHRKVYNDIIKQYGQAYSIVEAVAQKWDSLVQH